MAKFLSLFVVLFCFASVSAQSTYERQHNDSATAALYYHPKCHHCKTVMKYLNSNNIAVVTKNTSNPTYRAELNRMGQKGVPVLVVNGRAIAGSTAIISFLKQNSDALP